MDTSKGTVKYTEDQGEKHMDTYGHSVDNRFCAHAKNNKTKEFTKHWTCIQKLMQKASTKSIKIYDISY